MVCLQSIFVFHTYLHLFIVDLFYFKTCWFRQAKPIEENIFCSKLPEIHYTLQPCHKSQCSCCQPSHSRRHSEQWQAIPFNLKEKFQFVHGYQAILNCPAVSNALKSVLFESF